MMLCGVGVTENGIAVLLNMYTGIAYTIDPQHEQEVREYLGA
jgi:hypothetical protein